MHKLAMSMTADIEPIMDPALKVLSGCLVPFLASTFAPLPSVSAPTGKKPTQSKIHQANAWPCCWAVYALGQLFSNGF